MRRPIGIFGLISNKFVKFVKYSSLIVGSLGLSMSAKISVLYMVGAAGFFVSENLSSSLKR